MPEHLRALIAILFFALAVFWLAKRPLCEAEVVSEDQFDRDRNAWLAMTLIAFLSHNFWLFIVVAGFFAYSRAKRADAHIALYILLVLALPPEYREIPGIGPIDHIIVIDYYRLLSLTLLLPLALHLYRTRHTRGDVPRSIDFFVCGLLAWMFIVRATQEAPIHALRGTFYSLSDTWLPYYVASRGLRSLGDFRRVAAAFVLACAIVSVIAVFESTRHWLLYSSLPRALGFPEGQTPYLLRSAGGPLRAKVSLGNSIVLGYVITLGLAMAVYLGSRLRQAWIRRLLFITLIAGLIGTLSRGPWVGAAAMGLMLLVFGPNFGTRLSWTILVGACTSLVLLVSPLGDAILPYLPFIGTAETGTVDYRARLWDISMIVFKQNPIVGDLYYLRNPIMEQMRQGEGIIDMVNTYLQIALPFGAIGVLLFAGMFLSGLQNLRRTRRQMYSSPEEELLGRCLLAGLIAILIIIGTVSSIGAIPAFYCLWVGLCASYGRLFGLGQDTAVRRRKLRAQTSST